MFTWIEYIQYLLDLLHALLGVQLQGQSVCVGVEGNGNKGCKAVLAVVIWKIFAKIVEMLLRGCMR